ncbi:MAG: methyltransferase domain-containing protein [Candidatus Ozemobacteraceae bacterium]
MLQCPQCHKDSRLCFTSRDYNRKISRQRFQHYRCSSCGLIFISPIPPDLGKYYPETYYAVPATREQLAGNSEPERFKIELVNRFITNGRLLEIGPAYGCFTWLAKEAGFETEAIEMDARCCRFLTDVMGIKAVNNSDTAAALEGLEPYNVITLWHVIEHLPDPWTTLEAMCKKLLPGGILVIAAPNPDAFQFHVLGRYWPHVDAPRHLMLIPASVIAKKVEALGFKTVLLTTTDKGSLGWNGFGWEQFFSNFCSLRYINRILRMIGRVVSIVMKPIERVEGRGSAYTLVLKKEKLG